MRERLFNVSGSVASELLMESPVRIAGRPSFRKTFGGFRPTSQAANVWPSSCERNDMPSPKTRSGHRNGATSATGSETASGRSGSGTAARKRGPVDDCALPGADEAPVAPVFVDGERTVTLKGDRIAEEFQAIVEAYVRRRYGRVGAEA